MKSLFFLLYLLFFFPIQALSSAPPSIPSIPLPENIKENNNPPENQPSEDESQEILEPPPQIKLNTNPPENEEEAFKRIKDYKLLINIIPPGTSKESVKKQLFAEYKNLVEPYLEDEEENEEEEKNEKNSNTYTGQNRENKFEVDSFERSERNGQLRSTMAISKPRERVKTSRTVKTGKFKYSGNKNTIKTVKKEKKNKSVTVDKNNDVSSSIPLLPLASFAIISLVAVIFLIFARKTGGTK